MKTSLNLRFSQNLTLTPQLQQSIKLLQLSAIELEQELIQAAEQNPLIEYQSESSIAPTEPISQLSHLSISSPKNHAEWDEEDDRFAKIKAPETLLDHLLGQIRVLRISDQEKALLGLLAGNLDDRGYLGTSLEELAKEFSPYIDLEDGSELEQTKRALSRLQHLDPPGVGARDLAECLKLQLENFQDADQSNKAWQIAHTICQDYLEIMATRDWSRLKKNTKMATQKIQYRHVWRKLWVISVSIFTFFKKNNNIAAFCGTLHH